MEQQTAITMRRRALKWQLFIVVACVAVITGCTDPDRVFDQNTSIANRNWAYANLVKYNVNITDETAAYNLYFNLRVSGDYKYANIFVLLHTSGPGQKPTLVRYELKLAKPDGEWLGSGSGSLYSFQIPFKGHYHFPARGTYHFAIEQNMRDNPLRQVSDVGLRIEKAQ